MAILTTVQPGQLISADQMNLIISEIGALKAAVALLSGNVGTGTIAVPNVFGRTFAQTKAIFAVPTLQLAVGSVVDVNGNLINVNGTQSNNLLVINQVPQPGTLAAPGTSVNLVLSASASGPVAQPPVISSTDISSVQVTGTINIFGQNFAPLNTDNIVKFNGVQAIVSKLSTIGTLIVTVPTGVVGAPTKAGDPALAGVTITVQTQAGSTQAPSPITLTAPPAVPPPQVQSIQESTGVVGNPIHIVLANFTATPTINSVTFDTVPGAGATVATGVGGTFVVTVTVPNGITGVTLSGVTRFNVPIVVVANGSALPAFPENLTHI